MPSDAKKPSMHDSTFPHSSTKTTASITAVVALLIIVGTVIYGVTNPPIVEEEPAPLPELQQAAPIEVIDDGFKPKVNLSPEEFSYIPQNISENNTLLEKTVIEALPEWKVVYEENFERGASRWRGLIKRNAHSEVNDTVRTGNVSIMLNESNTNLVFDVGYPFHDGVFVCHFFDNMTDYQQSYCGVSVYPSVQWDSILFAGVNTQLSREQYMVYDGKEWVESGVWRHRGWHKVTFDARERINYISLDDQEVYSTANHSVWRYFHLYQDDDIPALEPGYFDDVLIGVTVKRR